MFDTPGRRRRERRSRGQQDPLARMRNLGPISAARLRAVGIDSPEELRRVGAVEAYMRLKKTHPFDISVVFLYALHGALTETDWRLLSESTRARLRREVLRRT
jgi:DNA transformation protein and related proteins